MPHAVSMPSTGLQALILCGPGSSFPTFTSNPDENPKALLPIANRPMVWYPIDFCYRMGVTDITLVCPPSASEAINTAVNTNPYLTALPLPRPDVLAPPSLDYNTGTAEILRLPEVRDQVKSDFIVLPCDLVCEIGGEKLLQAWMVKSASLTDVLNTSRLSNGHHTPSSGGLGVWYDTKAIVPIKKEETDFIAIAPAAPTPTPAPKDSLISKLTKLVYSIPTDSLKDLTEERKGLPLRHGLIREHPRVRMLTTHRDAHIYIFPKWTLDFVKENERFDSIGEDVVGWWAKSGWQKGLAEKLRILDVCEEKPSKNDDASPSSPTSGTHSRQEPHGPASSLITGHSPLTAVFAGQNLLRETGASKSGRVKQVPPILAYVHSGADQAPGSLIRRVDTAQLLLALSLQLAKIPSLEENGPESSSPYAHNKKIAYPDGVKSRTTITKQDCLIDNNVTIEEKTSIKECVIGANCQINEGAKLSQCLLMDGVVVGKGCKLTKCILGKRCVIGDGSVLTDVEVQENLLVEPRTEDKEAKLMSSEGLEATEAEMEEVLQEQEMSVEDATEG